MTTLQPLGENILVRPLQAESQTASGIIIPDSAAKEKPMKGEIIAMTPASADNANTFDALSVGATVWFTKYAPTEIKIDGEELYLIDLKSVLAIEQK